MSDAPAESAARLPPRCGQCGIALVLAPLPPRAFGVPGAQCFDCDDASPARALPWACPRCGGVFLIDAAGGQ